MIFVQIIGKLGQLPSPKNRVCAHHKGRIFFCVSLLNMQIEHEGDQRPL